MPILISFKQDFKEMSKYFEKSNKPTVNKDYIEVLIPGFNTKVGSFLDIYNTSQITTRTSSHKFISDVTAMLKSTSLILNCTK